MSHDLSHSHSKILELQKKKKKKKKFFVTYALVHKPFALPAAFIVITMLFIIKNVCF